MEYAYLFFLSILTGSIYSMKQDGPTRIREITGFEMDRELITVDRVIVKINYFVENNNYDEAQRWFSRLELLASADWKCFDIDQIEKYQEIYSELYDKVNSIKPKNGPKLSVFKRLDQEGKLQQIENDWLIAKLTNNQCAIDWTELLGKSKNTVPSPKTLRKNRIESLVGTGQIKEMDK